jgi:AcrR family transcriptional regulator
MATVAQDTTRTPAMAPAPAPARHSERRAALVEEAARLFGRQGYDKTSMRDIAAAFGILPGSLYHHFASKEQLFVAVYAAGVDRMIDAVHRATAGATDPVQRLEAACVAHLRELLGAENAMAPVLVAWPARPPALRDALVRERDRYERVLDALLADVALKPGVERRFFRLSLLGAVNWALAWYQPGRESPDTIARKIFAVFRPMLANA